MLPGLVTDQRLFHAPIAGLSGLTTVTVADLTTYDDLQKLAQSAIDQAPTHRFVLAGLSMGGYVAMEIMRRIPDRVAGLILMDTSPHADTVQASENRRTMMRLAEDNYDMVIRTMLPKLLHPDHLNDPAIADTVIAMAHDIGTTGFCTQQKAIMSRIDSVPSLAEIRCPTLVLCGRDDVITPVAIHEEMRDAIPNAALRVIDHCGHLSPMEQPLAVTDALQHWLTHTLLPQESSR